MKVLLISANTESINMVTIPVGLGAVAQAARGAGHEVEWLDLMNAKDPAGAVKDAVARADPEVAGVSVRNIDDQAMANNRFLLDKVKDVIAALRENTKAPIVLGGAGYSIFPKAALEYLGADCGIQGEGEIAFLDLLDRLGSGREVEAIPGLYERGREGTPPERIARLDEIAMPSADLWSSYKSPGREIYIPFQTRRGCPLDCSYCSTSTIEGRIIRKRPVEKVVAALAEHTAAGFDKFFFTDNTFNLPRSYAGSLCQGIVDAGLKIFWRCIIYPGGLGEDLVRLMAQAGCREVSIGFESGSDEILKAMNKRFTAADVKAATDLFKVHGIRRMGFLLLGGPGETRETVLQSLEFADGLGLDALRVSAGIRIYPYTALSDTAREEGVISPSDNLLIPRFYLARGLDDWLQETVREWASTRRNWIL